MAFKFVVFAACLALANAGFIGSPLGYANHGLVAPVAYAAHHVSAPVAVTKTVVDAEFNPNPQYSYSYGVHDSLTGDSKSQVETRNGDAVQGQYSLIESDGTRRTVDYTADDVNGFNAVVSKTPVHSHVVAAAPAVVEAKIATPIVQAAPAVVAARVAAPAVYSAAPAVAYSAYNGYNGFYAGAAPQAVAYNTHVAAPGHLAYSAGPAHVAYSSSPAHVAYSSGVAAPGHLAYSAGPAHYAYNGYASSPVAYHSGYGSPVARAYYH